MDFVFKFPPIKIGSIIKLKLMSVSPTVERICLGHKDRIWTMTKIDEKHVATGSEDGTIRIWNFKIGTCVHILSGHFLAVFSLLTLENGTLVSASKDGTIRFCKLFKLILRGHCDGKM
jgi:WD40 repeat protein